MSGVGPRRPSLMQRLSRRLRQDAKSYCARLYYSNSGTNSWEVYFVITWDLELHIAATNAKYAEAAVGSEQEVMFEGDEIQLDIAAEGVVLENGWTITPFTHPGITKSQVDHFVPGGRVPSCQLHLEWHGQQEQPVELAHRVKLLGAKEPNNWIVIFIQPPSLQGSYQLATSAPLDHHPYYKLPTDLDSKYAGLESEPELSDLMNEVASKVPSKWRQISIQLGLTLNDQERFMDVTSGDHNQCFTSVFKVWKSRETRPYTWSTVIEALESPAVDEMRLARELRTKLQSGSGSYQLATSAPLDHHPYYQLPTGLGSKYAGLDSKPELPDLMNEVASKVPSKWKQISIQLGLTPSDQECFTEATSGDPNQCFAFVFHVWKNRETRPYTWSTVIEVLEAPAVDEVRLAQELRTKLQSGSDTVRRNQCYEREMRYGFITTFIVKLLLFGIAGSGKTSVTAIMMGDDPPQVRISTPLMIRPVQVITVFIDQLMEWKKKTAEEVLRIIANVIRSRETESQVQPLSTHSEQVQEETTEDHSLSPHSEYTHEKAVEDQPTLPQLQPKSLGAEFDSLLESAVKEDDFLSLVHNSDPPTEPILKQSWLYITDSGGQPEFHNMLSIFVQNTTACIFIFRLHEGLDDCPPVAFYDNTGNPVSSPHHSRLTNRQIFQQFMSTMRSFISKTGGDPPRIVLLATHRDLVEEHALPKLLQEKHKQLKAIVLPQFKGQLIYCDEQLEEFIFTMNAKQPEKMDRETANTIRKVITKECPGEKVDVPIRWHLLDHRSRKVSDDLNRKVLSREEYGRIAASLNISEESCEGALNFFNSLNTIFYFPKALPNLVFLDPQILLDKFSELVAKSYRMNLDHKPAQPRTVQAMKPKKCHFQFRDFAQVTEELLNEFSVHYYPPLFTSRQLVILFEKLLIFGKLRKGVWFVPSILPPLKEEQVPQYCESKAGALLINFPDGGPQNGIFCSTVAYLLSPDNTFPCPWEVLMDCDKPVCLTRNVILFTMEDFPGEVTLIEQWTHFEIHVRTDPEREGDVWQLVHRAMFHGLAKAAEAHHYSSTDNVPQPAIVCPKHYNLPTPHPATISYKGKWKCTQSSRWFGQVSTETVPWLNLLTPHTQQLEPTSTQLPPLPTATPTTTPTTTPTSVTLPQLICFKTRCGRINILEQIGTRYWQLGVLLLEDAAGTVTEAIITKHNHDADAINWEILQKWIHGKGKKPVQWATLVEVLNDIKLSELAMEMKENLKI